MNISPTTCGTAALLSPGVTPRILSFLTQNCYGLPVQQKNRRFLEIAGRIRDLKPDLVLLQEVLFRDDERFFRIDGYHRSCFPGPVFLAGGLLILSRVRPERIRFHVFHEQGRLWDLQLSDRLLGKGWLEAEFPEWGLTVINTHLVSVYDRIRGGPDERQGRQLDQLLSRIHALPKAVLGGDLNFTPQSSFYRKMLEWGRDLTIGIDITCPADRTKIDYLFSRGLPDHETETSVIICNPVRNASQHYLASDHFGLISRVRMPSSAIANAILDAF